MLSSLKRDNACSAILRHGLRFPWPTRRQWHKFTDILGTSRPAGVAPTPFGRSWAMTNESKFRHETVTHCNSGAAEFLALAEELGIDLGAMVDPRTELSFAMARRKCSQCTSKAKCTLRQRIVTLSEVAPFCPAMDLFV